MAYPSVTYTFTNGTTASATEVNQNFTDLINGLSDGTKDISISALTVAGTASLNGAVNIGNATSDDIAVNGYITTALIPKADDSYDLGTSALAWQDAYFEGVVYTDTIQALNGSGLSFKENGGTEVLAVSDAGAVQWGTAGGTESHQINGDTLTFRKNGTTATTFRILDSSANLRWILGSDGNGSSPAFTVYNAANAGVYIVYGGTSWNSSSDIRLKKNVKDLEYGLTEITALRPVRYDFNADNSDTSKRIGFIAQEVLPHIPEAVDTSREFYGLSNVEMIPVLVKAVQELSAKLDEANASLAALEAK
jgi:hypothetical protein